MRRDPNEGANGLARGTEQSSASDGPGLEAPRKARRQRSGFDNSTAVAAGLGFICGAVCWHLVGFWAFVNEVVFHEPASMTAPSRTAVRPGPPTRATNNFAACTIAVRDAKTATVRLLPCRATATALQSAGRAGRGDLEPMPSTRAAIAVLGWNARVESTHHEETGTNDRNGAVAARGAVGDTPQAVPERPLYEH